MLWWSVMTPLFEAAVNNDFHETNETSFYGESLRSFIGLPQLNWGIVFKPLVWLFSPFRLRSLQLLLGGHCSPPVSACSGGSGPGG